MWQYLSPKCHHIGEENIFIISPHFVDVVAYASHRLCQNTCMIGWRIEILMEGVKKGRKEIEDRVESRDMSKNNGFVDYTMQFILGSPWLFRSGRKMPFEEN